MQALFAAASLALAASVAGQPQGGPPNPPKLETPTWLQSAFNIIQDNAGATILAAKQRAAELPTVVCGTPQHAVSVEVFGSVCNVTQFDITDVLGSRQAPTACTKWVFGKDTCTKYPGTLSVAIAPASGANGFVDSANPDLAGFLAGLGMANLEEVGSLSVDVLFPDYIHVDTAAFLPRLKKVAGVPEAKSNDPSLQMLFGSQFKLNGGFGGGGELSFAKLDFTKLQSVEGTFQVGSTAAEDLNSFAALQTVSKDFVVTNNNQLTSFWTSGVIALKTIGGGMFVAYNPYLASFGTPATALSSIGLAANTGLAPNGLQVMGNPALESFAGLNYLQKVGGALLVINNTALTSLAGLEQLATVNATGIPSLRLPNAFKGLEGFQLKPPSVLVTSNPKLADISALSLLAGCAGKPQQTAGIIVEVNPANSNGLRCTLTGYPQICEYINNQNQVPESSSWRRTGVCMYPTK